MSTNPTDGANSGAEADSGQQRSFWKTEDCQAVWLAFVLIAVGSAIWFANPPREALDQFGSLNEKLGAERERAPFRTLAWHELSDEKAALKKTTDPTAKKVSSWLPKIQKWKSNPVEALVLGEEASSERSEKRQASVEDARAKAKEEEEKARLAESLAATANFEDTKLNDAADEQIREYRAMETLHAAARKRAKVKAHNQFPGLVVFGVIAALLIAFGVRQMGGNPGGFLRGFAFVYLLAIVAYVIAAQSDVKAAGFGYAAWAILLGLLISNTLGTPRWITPAVQSELYIKVGLVLLGVEILFGKILVIGLPGIFVAWVVTPIVFVATYLFGQYVLKISSRSLNLTLSADMSVCGVSAAIATAAACRAKKEELTLAVGISLIFTSIMMIALPNLIRALGMDPVLGGAWIGGTIDATGAVAAAGAFLGDRALYTAATIKMIQNILIGVIAFCVAVYWVTKVERSEGGERPTAWEIWRRFPKFVLGFIAASVIFSIAYESLGSDAGGTLISNGLIAGWTKTLRGWFFCLAFVSIGLATDFRALKSYLSGGKPVLLYLCGQALNLALTLGVAYLMFFVVFKDVAAKL